MADQQARIDGRAVFGAAAYLIAVALVFLLERIGAPRELARALDPLTALAALALLGGLLRSSRVASYFAADRAVAPFYAGLAFAATAAGLFFCLDRGASPVAAPPFSAVAVGIGLGGLVVGPLARRTGASSFGDLLAARFANRPLRLFYGAALFAIGALIAAAAFDEAVNRLAADVGASRNAAIVAVALVGALCVAPGGLAGLLWTSAAAAGMIAVALLLPIGSQLFSGGSLTGPLWQGAGDMAAAMWRSGAGDAAPSAAPLIALAAAIGIAVLPPFSTGALAGFNAAQAMRGAIAGMILAALFALAFFAGRPLWPNPSSAAADGLRTSGLLVTALVLVAAGAQTASRAIGADPSASGYHGVLASQRLAQARGLALIALALCAVLSHQRAIDPAAALIGAAALSLAFVAPSLALASWTWARPAHAAAAVLASVATSAVLIFSKGGSFVERQALASALMAATAGFAAGWATRLFRRAGEDRPNLKRPELFIDAPFDSGG